ncbi:DNA repair protein RadA [Candidatus Amesbacteria bacterium RIFCSPHIGHO2_01_FULL_48_32]|uniref:DNA repair protein RadA n=1 Tax=Candidatus Amesbacteria bacterium RIFCSPLOWO2_01_FULL_48_25 TaxID=1797259 RepID=A0A1F4ZDA2_9BACT|nr:MAG: DNA repair protein RadA [Candidatus Amesbacteria bacterium RIFCSPHIGHO2_01_FULL_48_32]OGD04320.1 MAG: DNA repair protein RadA [Candidatus Amesbacteria bacterium RIFCSPLOWO2_01_FULL_48_25]HJZ05522.1 DNA repair protein RadA [Patescibacteria group bacterium]
MKSRSQFVCQQCGYAQSQWAGRCPSCDTWNSLVETVVSQAQNSKVKNQNYNSKIYKLSEIKVDENERIKTGERELDSVLGGGLVPGMVVLVAGEPGIGKSTLLTQVALKLNRVLYVCGEESASQVALRVKRLGGKGDILLLESTDADAIVAKIEEVGPEVIIVDSIQTLTTSDLTGTAGSVGQVRECALRLATSAKSRGKPLFLIGHVTKEGSIAGPRVLEHMVDCVLWFEGERGQRLRVVRAVKNRFGPTDEVGVFDMTEKGMSGVNNPSEILLSERVIGVAGSVVSVVLEGRRPLLVEIQSLVVPSQLVVPRRVTTGVDLARIQMLVAVLTRRAGLHLETSDIYVNVTSGIRLADRGVDLAICLAVASAFLNKPLSGNIAAVGEVGLLGEVRKVGGLEKRVKEAKKLGYRVASAESGKSVAAAIKKLLH